MRTPIALVAAALLAACAPDTPTAVDPGSAALSRGKSSVPNALPDLIVDARATQNNWVTRVEDFPANFCSVIEGGVSAGTHKVLRFSVTTPNIGQGDVYVGSPLAHMDPNGDGDFADQDGLFEFASCHAHFHFQHYATYALIDANGHEWRAAKQGFCMLDTDPYNTKTGDGGWQYRNCGSTDHDGNQGVTAGWADTYVFKLGGQYFVLDGGDGQAEVPPGTYTIRVVVNPPFAPVAGEPCPVTDPQGMCHQFAESNYANNVGEATVQITSHPGRAGYGPLKNAAHNTKKSDEIDHHGQ